ncbi:MAG: malate synthase A [Bdellovibrionaceae bacterium]|nr:malate synthase A [Pseudobdellovibrionaceae bacterium]
MQQNLTIKKFTFKNYSSENFNLTENQISESVLNVNAINFLYQLHTRFNPSRKKLLQDRFTLAKKIDAGFIPRYPDETAYIRNSQWSVAKCPADLNKRKVEITGPAEAKMIINALNSGADVFMADLEDALSPTWENILVGHFSLMLAGDKKLTFNGDNGKKYSLNANTSALLVRPRGLHLEEKNIEFDHEPMAASLFDFGLNFFLTAKNRIKHGSGPYYYLPKMESYLEAQWWNEVFEWAQAELQIPKGTIRATVLIETCLAALQMDEILHSLKDHAAGLNAGRWDYIFSFIKKFKNHQNFIFPDRQQVTMGLPFMKSYCELLVKTCHARGAHAIGGMAAFIPNRNEPEVTAKAIDQIKLDKKREADMGFDGTWVAHPDLIPIARSEFDAVLPNQDNQKQKKLNIQILPENILNTQVPHGQITENGIRTNINVSLLYLDRWLSGVGAAALYNLMEDAATAEISRSELWQWLKFAVALPDGQNFNAGIYQNLKAQELEKIKSQFKTQHLDRASEILDQLVLAPEFTEFLTTHCYKFLT